MTLTLSLTLSLAVSLSLTLALARSLSRSRSLASAAASASASASASVSASAWSWSWKALERRLAGEQRNARLEAERARALELKRRKMEAKHTKQTEALRFIRMGEEENKREIKRLGEKQQAYLEKQRRETEQRHERHKFLMAARDAEKKNCVERTVRATEHVLQQRVEKHMAMEGRASKLQAERLALIEDRSRRAKALALQRAAVQDQFKRYAHTWGPRAPDPGPDPDPDPTPQPGRAPWLPLTLNPDPDPDPSP